MIHNMRNKNYFDFAMVHMRKKSREMDVTFALKDFDKYHYISVSFRRRGGNT